MTISHAKSAGYLDIATDMRDEEFGCLKSCYGIQAWV